MSSVPNNYYVDLAEWTMSRTTSGKAGLLQKLQIPSLPHTQLDEFKLMVKGDLKPKLDDTCLSDIPSGQNIVYHERAVCACFSVCFIQMTKRLKAILNRRAKLFVGVDLSEFALDIQLTMEKNIAHYSCSEIDISKYDKSQNDFTKAFELRVYEYLGMPKEMLDLWAASEFNGIARMISSALAVDMGSQRRTGTANTWLGNTLINMMLLSEATNVHDFALCCFSGDDSLLLYDKPVTVDLSRYSAAYGFDVKYYHHSTPYFCSKFLVEAAGKLHYVPDPFKIFIKFGAEGAPTKTLLKEKWASFYDITTAYDSEEVCNKLAHLCAEKNGASNWWYAAIATIHCIRANPTQFARCWETVDCESIRSRKSVLHFTEGEDEAILDV
uniref:RdRp n=1 Tax=Manihot esculenta associated ampelovirus 2 TaxID=2843332 RepID=A0A8F1NMD9_9CLOS|nr:RdRp [Manihot esculenta associated ampelovirus 2]